MDVNYKHGLINSFNFVSRKNEQPVTGNQREAETTTTAFSTAGKQRGLVSLQDCNNVTGLHPT